jgi:hypothetical protein
MKEHEVLELRKKGLSYAAIGRLFGVSRQRAHQVVTGYTSSKKQDRTYAHVSLGKGRDYVRQLVRKRDDFTCQSCFQQWEEGRRHFDVHHLDGLCGKKSKGYDRVGEIGKLITLCHRCHFNHDQFSQAT